MSRIEGKFQAKRIGEKRYELDVRGLACPYPQLIATRALGDLSADDVLEIILDNPPSVKDIPPALELMGHKVLGTSRPDNSAWKIMVKAKK